MSKMLNYDNPPRCAWPRDVQRVPIFDNRDATHTRQAILERKEAPLCANLDCKECWKAREEGFSA